MIVGKVGVGRDSLKGKPRGKTPAAGFPVFTLIF